MSQTAPSLNTSPLTNGSSTTASTINLSSINSSNGYVINTMATNHYPYLNANGIQGPAWTSDYGTIMVSSDIVLSGESINERLARIEDLLHIPTRDIDLENKYPELKELWQKYNEALENYRNWERLKND